MNSKYLLLVIFLSLNAHAFRGLELQNGCKVYSSEGKVELNLPGDRCILFDDGSFINSTSDKIRSFSPTQTLLWELSGSFHHQLKPSKDRTKILVLASAFNRDGRLYRDDVFMVVSLAGKVLHQITFPELVSRGRLLDLPLDPPVNGATRERSHFNSFFEIPEVPARKDAPWLVKGNYIVNSIDHGIFVLPPDLSKVLHHIVYPRSESHTMHDVKVSDQGNLLFFNNQRVPFNEEHPYSTIEEVDPVTLKEVFVYGGKKEEAFYSEFCGGVQELDEGHIAFSLNFDGVHVVSKKKHKVVWSSMAPNKEFGKDIPTQNVRIKDLSTFLKKSQDK